MPAVKKCNNVLKDQRANTEHTAFINVVQGMWDHPDIRTDTEAFVRSLINAKEVSQQHHNNDVFEYISTIGATEASFRNKFITNHTKITVAALVTADQFDPEASKHIFCYMMHSTPPGSLA